MLGPSEDEVVSPDSVTSLSAWQVGPSAPFNRAHGQSMRLVRGSDAPDERDQAPPDVQIVLITQGGLELPLVDSPGQVAHLLQTVTEMASDIARGGPKMRPTTADQRPHPVPTGQVLDRVRVVVRWSESTNGDAA